MTSQQKKLINRIIKEEVHKILNESVSSKSTIIQFLVGGGSKQWKEEFVEVLIPFIRRATPKNLSQNQKDLILQEVWKLRDIPGLKDSFDEVDEE